jgi:hypothetical protein
MAPYLKSPEPHEIPGLGRVSIGQISWGDAQEIEEATADHPEDYADHVFVCMVVEPPLTVEAASKLEEATAAALVELAADRLGLKDELENVSRSLPARRRLYEADRARWAAMAEIMKPMAEEAAKRFAEINASMEPFMEQAAEHLAYLNEVLSTEASRSIVRSLESLNASLGAVVLPVITDFGSAMKVAAFPQIDQVVSLMAKAKLPSWVLDDSLIRSGINTALIHTPSYATRSPAIKREPSQSELELRRLSDALDALAKFEVATRELIRSRLTATTSGVKWWKQRVPQGVIDNCEKIKQAKEKPGGVSHHAIYYAYPDDYLKIIIRKDNWLECFREIFKSTNAVQACFQWIGTSRPGVAHARPLGDSDYANFMFSVSWVLRAINEAS